MCFEKTINLTAYKVEYVDQREQKPRKTRTETVVLDGGRLSALNRLGLRPAGYIVDKFTAMGYCVTSIRKGESRTVSVDLNQLWDLSESEERSSDNETS